MNASGTASKSTPAYRGTGINDTNTGARMEIITGNHAAAHGARMARAQVVAAYPITPQTTIVERIADMIAAGEFETQFIKVESEHSAMAACIAASNTGARTFTATSAHGLTLMHELLHWAAGARTPVVMSNVNRAMGPPWSVWADHTDCMSQRDTGWMTFHGERNQEVLDTILQAYKVAEDHDVLLPCMITEDAFYLSHTVERVELPDQELVDDFLPPFDPIYKLDTEDPHMFGSLSMPHQYYPELRYKIAEAHEKAIGKFRQVDKEFGEIFGRSYGLVDEYRTEDAEIIFFGIGTTASTAKDVVDELRDQGHSVGFARIRMFRPFPVDEVRRIAKDAHFIGVIDRSMTFGYEGPLFTEIKSALYENRNRPMIKNYLTGIGGRDVTHKIIAGLFTDAFDLLKKGEKDIEVQWIDLKGEQRIHRRGVY